MQSGYQEKRFHAAELLLDLSSSLITQAPAAAEQITNPQSF